MARKNDMVVEEVTNLIEPVLDDMGVEIVDVAFLPERGRWILRIYVDEGGGVTLDRCAQVSREIGPLIDMQDLIPHGYVLEVSSPGLNRPLKREKDFLRAVGKKVRVKMRSPVNGRRKFTGTLESFGEGMLALELEYDRVSLPWKDLEKANLVYDFDA